MEKVDDIIQHLDLYTDIIEKTAKKNDTALRICTFWMNEAARALERTQYEIRKNRR